MCGRQGILKERMRNRSCFGCELILDFLFNWISLFFFMYLQSILGLFGDMSYLSFVNFCFFLHLQLMLILSVVWNRTNQITRGLSKWSKSVSNKNKAQLAKLCVTRWWSCVLGQYTTVMDGTWWYLYYKL